MLHESLQQELKQFPKIRLLLVTTGQMNTELFKDVKPTKQFIAPVVDHVELAQKSQRGSIEGIWVVWQHQCMRIFFQE